MWCLEGEECVARKFKDRDESRPVLQKWEEEVEVGKILHPTQSHTETTPSSPCALTPPSTHPDGDSSLPAITPANASPTSPPLAMEELADHPNAGTETVPPPPCSNTTPPSQTGMVITRPVCGHDVLAAACHALTNGPGGPTAQLQHVESLLHDEWERPLDVIIPSSGSQQYKLEARHLRDVYSESYVTDTAEIVVYYWWSARTALSADWDVMGVAWVVRDSLWNVSALPLGRREVLAESWARRTLNAASIDMIYAPPLLVAQIYNKRNAHWMLRLLLVSPTRTFLCLVFDPLCYKPYIAGANTEELAIVNLIAEQEGIKARALKRWDKFLGEFGSVAFAIASLYSTFLHQDDGASCHPACLMMLHCLLSRRVVNGSIQLPQDRLWLLREIAQAALHYRSSPPAPPIETTPSWALARMYATPYCSPSRSSCFFCDDTAHITCPECGVYQCALHASGFCSTEICVALRKWNVQFTATLACIVLAFALGDRLVVDKSPSVDEVRPKVVIRGEEFFVPEHYPKDASGRLEYDKNLIKELEEQTTGVIRNMCKHNPPSAQPTYKDKKSDLISKRVFCDFI